MKMEPVVGIEPTTYGLRNRKWPALEKKPKHHINLMDIGSNGPLMS